MSLRGQLYSSAGEDIECGTHIGYLAGANGEVEGVAEGKEAIARMLVDLFSRRLEDREAFNGAPAGTRETAGPAARSRQSVRGLRRPDDQG